MSEHKDYYLPKYLDDPERFLFWSVEEAVAMFCPLMLGMYVDHGVIGLLSGIVCFWGMQKLIKNGENQIQLLRYWYFPQNKKSNTWLPPSYIREYLG